MTSCFTSWRNTRVIYLDFDVAVSLMQATVNSFICQFCPVTIVMIESRQGNQRFDRATLLQVRIKFKEHWQHMLVVLMMWLKGMYRTMKSKGHLREDGCVPS